MFKMFGLTPQFLIGDYKRGQSRVKLRDHIVLILIDSILINKDDAQTKFKA